MTQQNSQKSKNIIREYQPEDMPQLLELYKSVWGDYEYDFAKSRLEWQYFKNPNNRELNKPLFLVMEQDSKLVGMVCGIAIQLKVESKIYHADWVGDLMVHPKHRGRTGILLANAICDRSEIIMSFPASYITKLCRRAGGVDMCQYVTHRRIIDFDYILEEKGYGNKFINVVNFCWRPINKFFTKRNVNLKKNYKVCKIDHFDKRFDEFWNEVSEKYPVIGVRDSKYLNWRFVDCAHQKYTSFVIDDGVKVLGYVVIRQYEIEEDVKVGSIVDFLADPSQSDVIYALFQEAIKALQELDVQYIDVVAITPYAIFNKILRKLGFIFKIQGTPGLCYNNVDNEIYNSMKKPENWYITMADSDEEIS